MLCVKFYVTTMSLVKHQERKKVSTQALVQPEETTTEQTSVTLLQIFTRFYRFSSVVQDFHIYTWTMYISQLW